MATKKKGCCARKTQTKSRTTKGCAQKPQKRKESKTDKTRVTAHVDCGFPNNLFIRGEGISTLSWDKGSPMKNIGTNEWVWESKRPFSVMQFKVLINDNQYEQGENHTIIFGQEADVNPQF